MTYTIYVIALTITFIGFVINIACCIADFKEFKKLKKRVSALEYKK